MNLQQILPRPNSRNFIVGSVGSGKSTLGCVLLDNYAALHTHHRIVIIDPKRRFFGKYDENDSTTLFPDGVESVNHGRRDGVTVNAVSVKSPNLLTIKQARCYIVQDEERSREMFIYLMNKHDIRKPIMLYLDESMVFMGGMGRADSGLRRIIQMGRELGIGTMIINQRPAWIDKTLLSESDKIYVGSLYDPADCKRMAEYAPQNLRKRLLDTLPAKHFQLIDRKNQDNNTYFTLKI